MDSYDVIIIGTGAGGGRLHGTCPLGKRILLFERGDWSPVSRRTGPRTTSFVDNRYVSEDTWYDEKDRAFPPQIHYIRRVGDEALRRRLYRSGGRTSASSSTTAASRLPADRVRGAGAVLHARRAAYEVRARAAKTRPSHPQARRTVTGDLARARIQQLSDDHERPLPPVPRACGSRLTGRTCVQPCIRCTTCDGFPAWSTPSPTPTCSACGRAGASERDAADEREGRQARDERLGDEVAAVVVERDGQTESFAADIIVASCGRPYGQAPARIGQTLTRTASPTAPTRSGRNYMFHDSPRCSPSHREENRPSSRNSRAERLLLRLGRLRVPAGNIQMVGKSQAQMYGARSPARRASHRNGHSNGSRARDRLLAPTEDLPSPDNRVTLAPDGNVRLTYSETNAEARKRLYDKLKSLLPKLNMNEGHLIQRFAYMKNEIPVAGVAHQAGTCRFGTDPELSVLNTDCRAHELDNLYVVDPSVFPHRGGQPALTRWEPLRAEITCSSGGCPSARRHGMTV